MAATDGATTTNREAIATIIERSVPVFGATLGAVIRAPWGVQRAILWAIFILLIYPIFVFVVAMWTIQLLPETPRRWFQQQASVAFVDSQINSDHSVIDGSSLLEFDVSRDDEGGNVYIQRVSVGQPVTFLTYQDATPYPRQAADTTLPASCTYRALDQAIGDKPVGQLFVRVVGQKVPVPIDVDSSPSGLTNINAFDDETWKKIEDQVRQPNGQLPPTVDLRVSFQRADALTDISAACTKYRVFVIMTYLKPQL